MIEIQGNGFSICIPQEELPTDFEDDNVDVIVRTPGKSYVGTFYTPRNIARLLPKLEREGERGDYFCDAGMVIVRDVRPETIRAVVADLLLKGLIARVMEVSDSDEGPTCP